MRCLRNSGFYRRYMAEAALAMRDVMSREDEPSFVIKDPRYAKESTNSTSVLHIFKGRWLVGLGVMAMSLVFGQLICIPTRLASSWSIIRASWSTHARTHARTANAPPDILLQDEILVLIDKVIYRFVPPHNFDQFFRHDCFELHDEYFQEYPMSRDMVPSRNIPERVPFKWLKAIYGKRRT